MEHQFTGHLAIKITDRVRKMSQDERHKANDEFASVFEQYKDKVTLRGAYLTQGFRADTDLLLWMYGLEFDDIQDLQLNLRQTTLGLAVDTPYAFAGMTMQAEFNRAHIPAFMRGVAPKKYLCFYPFIRTPEWYLLPAEERQELLKEHGNFGREYPDVRTNNVYAFGLGDFEWVLSFETDDLKSLVPMVRRQRDAKARAYTKYEWPFIVGRRFELAEALLRI